MRISGHLQAPTCQWMGRKKDSGMQAPKGLLSHGAGARSSQPFFESDLFTQPWSNPACTKGAVACTQRQLKGLQDKLSVVRTRTLCIIWEERKMLSWVCFMVLDSLLEDSASLRRKWVLEHLLPQLIDKGSGFVPAHKLVMPRNSLCAG